MLAVLVYRDTGSISGVSRACVQGYRKQCCTGIQGALAVLAVLVYRDTGSISGVSSACVQG